MKAKLCWLVVVLAVVWAMKRYYADADVDDLRWMLGPTAGLAGAVSGAEFSVEPGAGYLSREQLFLIEKSCAGLNFMIAAFAMLTFVLRRWVSSLASGAAVLAVSLAAAYLAAVIVNAARITMAMWVLANQLAFSWLTPAQSHRVEGVAVYFAGLVLLHEVVRRLEYRAG